MKPSRTWHVLLCRRGLRLGHELLERGSLRGREPQAQLGTPPQHIVGAPRPFLMHEIPDLDSGQIGAKAGAEIGDLPRFAEYLINARTVSPHQAARVLDWQEWIIPPFAFDQCLHPVVNEIAARKMAFRRPRPRMREKVT